MKSYVFLHLFFFVKIAFVQDSIRLDMKDVYRELNFSFTTAEYCKNSIDSVSFIYNEERHKPIIYLPNKRTILFDFPFQESVLLSDGELQKIDEELQLYFSMDFKLGSVYSTASKTHFLSGCLGGKAINYIDGDLVTFPKELLLRVNYYLGKTFNFKNSSGD